MKRPRRRPPQGITLRRGRTSDLSGLLALERSVFNNELLSRQSLRHFLASPTAALIVAQKCGGLAGYVLVRYSSRHKVARVYSIAVDPKLKGRGLGGLLLAAADKDARRRRCRVIRLEVRQHNARAIARYEKSGYRLFGRRRDYYDDHATALRFEKPLAVEGRRRSTKKSGPAGRIGFHGGHYR
jgi:ribosomal protein S18 acetylase RimI-like enzyme